MNIRKAADMSGLPVKTIRYYDDIDLIQLKRDDNGYRIFTQNDVHKLAFLARARALGFTIDDCRALISLYEDKHRTSGDVKQIAQRHLEQIGEKIAALEGMRQTLSHLVQQCSGDKRPDCPILNDLAELRPPMQATSAS